MSRDDAHFMFNTELVQGLGCVNHGFPVTLGAHKNAYKFFHENILSEFEVPAQAPVIEAAG